MKRLLIHVEGQTEETFVKQVLAPHLYRLGYESVSARLIGNARLRQGRGGIRAWSTVRRDIVNHLREDVRTLSTTMVDYYGMPQSGSKAWPGRAAATILAFDQKPLAVGNAILEDIQGELGDDFDPSRFIPYVMMHEFEGLLFSDPTRFAQGIGRADLSPRFEEIRSEFSTPEEINDSPLTAPSHRVRDLEPRYVKPLMGTLAVTAIGLEAIRRECPIFRSWIQRLEEWAG